MSCFPCCYSEPDEKVQIVDLTAEDLSKPSANPFLFDIEDPPKPSTNPFVTPDAEDPPKPSADAEDPPKPSAEQVSTPDTQEPPEKELQNFIEYSVPLTKAPNEKIGLLLDMVDHRTAQVCEVLPGCIREYNKTAERDKEVKVGHFLVGVNGSRGDARVFVEMFKEATILNMVFRLANEYLVPLSCLHSPTIGFAVSHAPQGVSLLVTEVKEGAIMNWNDTHPDKEVKVWDRLVAVNGNRGKPADMLKEIQKIGQYATANFLFATVFDE